MRACEDCGAPSFDAAEAVCSACGAALPAYPVPQPKFCQFIQAVCGNPCGRSKNAVGKVCVCEHHTPPTD
jgi:hypothetical protein